MTTWVLIHGASSDAWYWHRLAPLLRARGHDVVTPTLPSDDDAAGFAEYADAVVDAIGDRRDLLLVAQSMAGFTAPLVCERLPVRLLVLLAAMVPKPGEAPGDWWQNTGHAEARRTQDERDGRDPDRPFDPMELFFHDVPKEVVAEAMERGEHRQSDTPVQKPLPLATWPDAPTRFLLCRHDRFLPADFQRRVVKQRLGLTPDEMDGGHLPALANPQELARRLEEYRKEAEA